MSNEIPEKKPGDKAAATSGVQRPSTALEPEILPFGDLDEAAGGGCPTVTFFPTTVGRD